MPVAVLGASGSGKSTVGAALAQRWGLEFFDADSMHSAGNVAKMVRGTPLTDADRWPWLEAVGVRLAADRGVVACSALRRAYRAELRRHCPDVDFLFLQAPRELLAARLAERTGHFMPAALLDSQLALLEPLAPDEPGLTLSAALTVDELLDAYAVSLVDRE